MKSCSLIDLEEDNRSEQAGTGAPSLLHQDLAALGLSDAPVTNKVRKLFPGAGEWDGERCSNLPPMRAALCWGGGG